MRGATKLTSASTSSKFAVVADPSVLWHRRRKPGIVHPDHGSQQHADELREALSELARGEAALILDLRGNAGGPAGESVEGRVGVPDAAWFFLRRTREGEHTTEATSGGAALDRPLVVLVNSGNGQRRNFSQARSRPGRGILIGAEDVWKRLSSDLPPGR